MRDSAAAAAVVDGSRRRRVQHHSSGGFSWDESSRLCDYTHIHSFSYDFYLRTVQDVLLSGKWPPVIETGLWYSSHNIIPLSLIAYWCDTSNLVSDRTRANTSRPGGSGGVESSSNRKILKTHSSRASDTKRPAGWEALPKYAVTDFLADLCFLFPKPPLYSRGCLSRLFHVLPITVRADQVFCRLIEDRNNYNIEVSRVRSMRGNAILIHPCNGRPYR